MDRRLIFIIHKVLTKQQGHNPREKWALDKTRQIIEKLI